MCVHCGCALTMDLGYLRPKPLIFEFNSITFVYGITFKSSTTELNGIARFYCSIIVSITKIRAKKHGVLVAFGAV